MRIRRSSLDWRKDGSTVGWIGYPNCGKTSLSNLVARSHSKTSNWEGTTVDDSWHADPILTSVRLADTAGRASLDGVWDGDPLAASAGPRMIKFDLALNVVDALKLEGQLSEIMFEHNGLTYIYLLF